MFIIAGCAIFMMIVATIIPALVWFDKCRNDVIKKITIMCLVMFICAGMLFWWAAYHVIHPIENGEYAETSTYDRNGKTIVTEKRCMIIVFGSDRCNVVKRTTTLYEYVYGEPTIETFGK